jgi:hypothetical protein
MTRAPLASSRRRGSGLLLAGALVGAFACGDDRAITYTPTDGVAGAGSVEREVVPLLPPGAGTTDSVPGNAGALLAGAAGTGAGGIGGFGGASGVAGSPVLGAAGSSVLPASDAGIGSGGLGGSSGLVDAGSVLQP